MPTSRQSSDKNCPDGEPVKRLILELSESLHERFEAACVATNRNVLEEVQRLLEHRTRELEDQAGLTPTDGGRPRTSRSAVIERRLRALDRALACNHPTADIDRLLADVKLGREHH